MNYTTQLFIISIMVFLVHNIIAENRQEECETLPSELHIIKGKFYHDMISIKFLSFNSLIFNLKRNLMNSVDFNEHAMEI